MDQRDRADRDHLLEKIFGLLNVQGKIDAESLHPFAMHSGFEGSMTAWIEEYEQVCSDMGFDSSGLSYLDFVALVDDVSDEDQQTTNEELKDFLCAKSKGKGKATFPAISSCDARGLLYSNNLREKEEEEAS